ncbi:MAG: hypothetical protein K8953_03070, partial [Proteobacteria bacterium]|nr:hypothetical protein [Pseudomonadota bacterium]
HGLLRVIGFIGQEGVVAAFVDRENTGVDGNKNTGNAGGFTASNPDHPDYVEAVVAEDLSLVETGADSNAILVNYEDWTESSVAPADAPTASGKSEFLQTTVFTDGTRGFSSLASGANAQIGDFNNADFRTRLVGGDATNGFAVKAQGGNFYAGVLHTASVGAPIDVAGLTSQNIPSAIWRGELVAQSGTATIRRPFDLTVSFTSNHEGQVGELDGTVRNDISSLSSGLLYTIDGRFNPRGVISGNILRGLISADLSGIIGQTGAIGVFASNETDNKFAGGFVAIPYQAPTAVTYSTVWKASHDAGKDGLFATPQTHNHWLEGGVAGTNGQSVAGITGYNGGLLRMSTATWNLGSIGTDVNDAVAFYTGLNKGGRYFYSGVTSGTDLGAPVQSKSGEATWYGQLSARQHTGGGNIATKYGDITLTVRYNQTGGTITGGLPSNLLTNTGYIYQIRGRFNEDGLVEGNVNTVSGANSQFRETGYLSGLIGQGGIVGAFVAPNFAGGFVARVSKPNFAATKTTYQDWAHFAGNRYGVIRSTPHNEAGLRNAFLHTNPSQNHNIIWGDIGNDPGREHTGRGAVSVAEALGQAGLTPPAGLKGGYSWLAGYWDRPSTHQAEGVTSLNRGYHAGLFQNIDVGLPLGPRNHYASSSTTATWKGHFYAHQNKTFADSKNTSTAVSFLVNYGTKRIGTTYTTANGVRIGGIYTISAHDGGNNIPFDDRGVIRGRISHKEAHIPGGEITGLIGQAGMIAVFVSDPDTGTKPHYGYTGGFIACPTLTRSADSGCIR